MLERPSHLRAVRRLLASFPVVGLLGARQVGKTTLAAAIGRAWRGEVTRFDLEDPAAIARLADPMLALAGLRGLVILDEIQHRPELFPSLRVLADRRPNKARFLVLGSASPQLLRQSAESLAGRIGYHFLPGLGLAEVPPGHWHRLWLRGGFPRAYLARSEAASFEWRRQFLRTFLERDLSQLGIVAGAQAMYRFWSMLAHGHGQPWNASEIGRSMGLADTTVRSYLDKMTDAFVMRQLQPWHENLGKRQVKAPKIYVRDTGLLHALLDLRTGRQLDVHARVGASWEGFVIDQIIQALDAAVHECYYWRTHAGAELDLLITRGARRIGFEVKRTTAPALTLSMKTALADLKLKQLYVVHAGEATFPLARQVQAVAFADLLQVAAALG
ncbi:MAG: ATP-binding protein [Gammaproteobacteria bacterium]|nr:MAG: ATP-binding protein [Gammaproteobacteria bacterium]